MERISTPPGMVDLRPCKTFVRKAYPKGHPLREAFMGEPDLITGADAVFKLPAYLRMAFAFG